MAELMMFQPGKAFMDSYNQAKAGSLAKIAMTDPTRRQSALADLAGLDPQTANSMKKEFDAQEQEQLKTFATAFLNTPDELKPQMYGRAKEMWRPRFQALGSDIPDDWRQALPTIQAIAGVSKNGKFTGAPIIIQTPNGPRYARYSESDIVPTDFAPSDSYRLEIDPATGQPYRFGTRSGQFEQAIGGYGGSNPAPPAGNGGIVFPQDISGAAQRTGDVMQQVRTEIAQLVAQGVPVADATSQVTQKYARQRGLTMPPQGQAHAPVVQQPVAPPVAQRPVPQYGGYQGMSAAEKARAEAEAKAAVELQYAPQVEGAKAMAKAQVEGQTAPQIEGAKAAAVETAKRSAISAADAPKFITTADQTLAVIDKAINHPGRAGATGMSAALPWQYAYGSKERDFITVSQQLEGKTFLQAFESLKGGGAITEMEGQAATKAIARLDRAQSEGEYLAALRELRQIVVDARNRAVQAARGNRAPAQPPAGKRVGRFVIEEN